MQSVFPWDHVGPEQLFIVHNHFALISEQPSILWRGSLYNSLLVLKKTKTDGKI